MIEAAEATQALGEDNVLREMPFLVKQLRMAAVDPKMQVAIMDVIVNGWDATRKYEVPPVDERFLNHFSYILTAVNFVKDPYDYPDGQIFSKQWLREDKHKFGYRPQESS
mmetsp:Transcript_18789/g.55869  ORF Transcript_18789/g.55869 Transcript_18789/m.55869 type:complete len:110 (-) Transcript_18789:48-377(-)